MSIIKTMGINKYQSQYGFTLIELMLALVLGLLVSAAALQLLITSSRNQASSVAASQIQDDGIFGLPMMRRQIMLANLGARAFQQTPTSDVFDSQYTVTDRTRQGGVVLTAPAIDSGVAKDETNLAKLKYNNAAIPAKLLSQDGRSADLPAEQKVSNLAGVNSDQLTIQYQAPYDLTNCEGRNVKVNQYVIERYFVREDGNDMVLACNAAIYDLPNSGDTDIKKYQTYDSYTYGSMEAPGTSTGTKNNNLDGKGTVLLPRVESFQVQLGITDDENFATAPGDLSIRYVSIDTYKAITTTPKPRIVSIKTALLVRSANNPGDAPESSTLRFDLLDETDKSLKANSSNQLRNIYTSTILIRNGRGDS